MATAAQLTNVANPYAPLTERQQQRVYMPTDPWSNQYAITIVRDSVNYMEQFVQQAGHLRRWTDADAQFVAHRPQRYWGTSRKPKARIPVYLLFAQLQALLPNVLQALFPLHENVDIAPRPGSTLEQARAAWELIMAQLETLGEHGILRLREILLHCLTQAYLYGNGVLEVSWLYKVIDKMVFDVSWEPQRQLVQDMISGMQFIAPVGPPQRIVRERIQKYILNQPNIQNIDIRDFLIDPQTVSPNIQDPSCRFCAVRHFPTIGEIAQMRGQPGYMIPDDYTLFKLAEQKPYTMADQAKRQSMSTAGWQFDPANDYTSDAYSRRLELIRWYSNERCVWTLNRTWAAYNRANIYGFKPFLNAFYVPFPNRWHGVALADVTEGDQNMIASLKEGRVDELSMALNAPFIRKQGTMVGNPGSMPMAPDKIIDVNDEPEKAIKRLDVQSQTIQIFAEVNDVYAQSARTTGISDMAVSGIPEAGGDSSQRTAAGVNRKASAAGTRLMHLVENAETSVIEPLCTILHAFNTRFLPRDQMISILGVDGKQKMIDPVMVLNAQPRFTVRAAARMKSRLQLLQVLPWFIQTLLNPELMGMMAQQYHKKLHLPNLITLVTDTLDIPRIELFMDMTPEEIQALSQPDPKAMLDMQKQRERLQAMAEMQQDRDETTLLNTFTGKLLTPRAAEDFLGFEDAEEMRTKAQAQRAKQQPKRRPQ